MTTTTLQNPASTTERRERGGDRRTGTGDRRSGIERRQQRKFVLINRRKSDGRRLLAWGRRYIPDRREVAKV